MNRISLIAFVAVALLIGCVRVAHSQETKPPLRLVQTISLPNVKGRLDHMDVDVKGKRLFVAGLENGTFEVVNLQAGKWMRSITCSRPKHWPYIVCNTRNLLWIPHTRTIHVRVPPALALLVSD